MQVGRSNSKELVKLVLNSKTSFVSVKVSFVRENLGKTPFLVELVNVG
jgi:hypothetical protein